MLIFQGVVVNVNPRQSIWTPILIAMGKNPTQIFYGQTDDESKNRRLSLRSERQSLNKLSRTGVPVILTIHQPSSEFLGGRCIYVEFDKWGGGEQKVHLRVS